MADLSNVKPRVNASMLPKYDGKVVTLMGHAHDADEDGMGFQLKACDDIDVHIKLSDQLQDYIEGLVEVQGTVSSPKEIQAFNYVQFGPEAKDSFDMETYNKAVTLTNAHADHYFQKDGFPAAS